MTDNQTTEQAQGGSVLNEQQSPQFTIAELGAKFGSQLGSAYAEIITLEKVLEFQRQKIEVLTKNEAALVDHIQDLKAQLEAMKKEGLLTSLKTSAIEADAMSAKVSQIMQNEKTGPLDGLT